MRIFKVKTKNRVKRPRSKERKRLKRLSQSIFKDGIKLSPQRVIEWSQQNRFRQTPGERRFGEILQQIKARHSFKAQQPLYGFIIDFYAPRYMLAVEIDGGYHETPEQREYDARRSQILQRKGIVFIRFTNDEVLQHPERVMSLVQEKIKNCARLSQIKVSRKKRKRLPFTSIQFRSRKTEPIKSREKGKVILLRRNGETMRKIIGGDQCIKSG